MDLDISGLAELERLAERLTAAGKDQEKTLRKAILAAARPAQQSVKTRLGEFMPSGYAPILSKALRMRTTVRRSAVSITAKAQGKKEPRHIGPQEQGILRHPVFGNRKKWIAQQVKSGFFTQPIIDYRPTFVKELSQALDDIAEKIAKG